MKKKNGMEILIFSIFAVVGIGLLIGAVVAFLSQNKFKSGAEPVSARIVSIERYRDHDGDQHHRVFVEYTFQGVTYEEVPLNYYASSMRVGKEITVYCDPGNPWDVRGESEMLIVSLILGGMGLIFALVGILPTVGILRRSARARRLKETGQTLMAQVEYVDINTSYSVNGRHPYVLYCQYLDPYSNLTYKFKSDNLWTDPSPAFPAGSDVPVLVKEGDYSVYHVNVEDTMNARIVDYT